MNKITSYKLIKRIPGLEVGTVFKESGNVDEPWEDKDQSYWFTNKEIQDTEFFEPIYEEEYKIGDYIIAIGADSIPRKLVNFRVEKDKLYWHENGIEHSWYLAKIRKATQQEIEALEIEIEGYKLKIYSKEEFGFGCNRFSRADLISYKLLVERGAKIEMFRVNINLELLLKIEEQLDNYKD